MDKDRPYWNMQIEPLLNSPEIRPLQFQNLKKHMAQLYQKSKVHRDYCDKYGGNPDKIQSIEDFDLLWLQWLEIL